MEANGPALQVLLAQFKALRDEIAERSKAQAGYMQLNITAIGALGGLGFSAAAGENRPLLLLIVPVISALTGLLWIDHAANIFNLGDFMKNEIMPKLQEYSAETKIPDYEVFVREYERNRSAVIRSFVLPQLLLFIFAPVVVMVIALRGASGWPFIVFFIFDCILIIILILYWISLLSGPRLRLAR